MGVYGLMLTSPVLFAFLAAAGALLAVMVLRPHWLLPISMLLAFTALPVAVPQVIGIAGVGVYIYEPPLVLAALYLWTVPGRPKLPRSLIAFGLVCVAATALGLANGWPTEWLIADARAAVDFAIASIAVYLHLRHHPLESLLKPLRWILWISAALTVAASATSLQLSGRAEIASLTGAQQGAERFLTAAVFPALAVTCVVLASMIASHTSFKMAMSFLAPALVILFLAFSRNNILAIAVALAWTVIASRSSRARIGGLARVVAVGLVVLIIGYGAAASGTSAWLTQQIQGFNDRVLGGLSSESRAVDASSLYRESENRAVWPVIEQSPGWGYGFGAEYKAPSGAGDSFFATRAPSYVHNGYLWLWLKAGAIGLVVFLVAMLTPLSRSLRRGASPALVSVAAGIAGLAGVIFVAPLIVGTPSCVALGALVGAGHAYGRWSPASSTHQESVVI